jgi:integrase
MPSFRSAATQAGHAMKSLQGETLQSVGTVRNYEQSLTRVAEWCKENKIELKNITVEQTKEYLEQRAFDVGQKTLNMERQAAQVMLQQNGKLEPEDKLAMVSSEKTEALNSRSYTPQQISMIADSQNERNSLSTEIAHASGLRAHELNTLQRIEERSADNRPALDSKFQGREGVKYTVVGKGGLVREVVLPAALAERLEDRRLDTSKQVTDRGINYQTKYDVAAGKNWSNSFSQAATRALGWSEGAHGVRHSYAQERMGELKVDMPYEKALETVSQEMGHFRPAITEVYLR